MIFKTQYLEGIVEITFAPHIDQRGSFTRIYDQHEFIGAGIPVNWLQENRSVNIAKGIVRGLHFLLSPHTDGKLIRCARGVVFDVVLDLRVNSKTQGKWQTFILDERDNKMIYIPKGFAHGFCTLSDYSEVLYKHDSYYVKGSDSGIVWNDPNLAIEWPVRDPIVSVKDRGLMRYQAFISKYNGL